MKIDVSDLLKKKIIKRNIDLIIEEKDFMMEQNTSDI
ncbi:Uncharacterised protein [Clostridium tetanomorphum]|nr:Uncharacterised protein [Clostridium tetanomorphum]